MRSACTPRREVKRVRQATVCHTCPTSAQTAGPLTSPEATRDGRRSHQAPTPLVVCVAYASCAATGTWAGARGLR
jgi:hypothetical protein